MLICLLLCVNSVLLDSSKFFVAFKVEGKLQTRTWEKEGQLRRKTEVIAENVQILYRPEEYRNLGRENRDEAPVEQPNDGFAEPAAEEDIF